MAYVVTMKAGEYCRFSALNESRGAAQTDERPKPNRHLPHSRSADNPLFSGRLC